MFFEKLKKKLAVLKCHTNLGNVRVNTCIAELGVGGKGHLTKLAIIKKVEKNAKQKRCTG